MSIAPNLLLLVDDEAERTYVADQLTADDHAVHVVAGHDHALAVLRDHRIDVAILDTDPVLADTLQLVHLVRTGTGSIDAALPIVTLGIGGAVNVQRALEHGADDHLARPYGYVELRARIAALHRRANGHRPHQGTQRIGAITIDPTARQVTVRGDQVDLSPKEYALLRELAAEPGRVFTKAELFRRIWGHVGASTRTLDTHACRLRRHLGIHGDPYVLTVWGVGYRLTDAVAR